MGIDRLDAKLLLLHALGQGSQGRAWLLAHDTDTL
ncbi:MAG: peptide chain release factor N(5)-glutamine methyltransferase, partial [Betaproteobacteria bacterium]|nr:peptide chain release factor N(5)-glutamine methyltransferase [Betaproteobacteria bacterium]NDE72856.1 peptide chain release factor N(5)-glutamine methyltransferase [Betaproteobacteria bacterium]